MQLQKTSLPPYRLAKVAGLSEISFLVSKQLHSIAAETEADLPRAATLATRLQLPLGDIDSDEPQLRVANTGLSIAIPDNGKPVHINFSSGKYDHRRKFGGGRGQPLAKAIGLKKGLTPSVIDATAGFARDAFVLATLGCNVMMMEQHPVISLLIEDALQQSAENDMIKDVISRMHIYQGNAITLLQQGEFYADVIYMDPMYPTRDKSARVKKDMQLLHQLIGTDTDSTALLTIARKIAGKRVVVKRPKGAAFVGDLNPSASIESKNTRYDIYVR